MGSYCHQMITQVRPKDPRGFQRRSPQKGNFQPNHVGLKTAKCLPVGPHTKVDCVYPEIERPLPLIRGSILKKKVGWGQGLD